MQILTKHLQAVLLAAAKKDVRFYLKGVFVTRTHLVGTDSHRMHVVCHGGEWHGPDLIIPRETVEMAVKLKAPTLELTPTALGPIAFTPIAGRYPHYSRVMARLPSPIDTGPMVAAVNPEYLRDACKAIDLVAGDITPYALALVNGAWVWSNPVFQVVITSLRPTVKRPVLTSLETLACLMTDRQFRALATLSGIGPSSLSYQACRDIYVNGHTQALAARTHELRPQTVRNSCVRIETVRAALPDRMILLQDAMGV